MAYLPPKLSVCLEHVLGRYASFSSHLRNVETACPERSRRKGSLYLFLHCSIVVAPASAREHRRRSWNPIARNPRGGHADGCLEIEVHQCFRGDLHLLTPGDSIASGADTASGGGADRSALAASRHGADERSQQRPRHRPSRPCSCPVLCPPWCRCPLPGKAPCPRVSSLVSSIESSALPEKWAASFTSTTRPRTGAPRGAATMPSTIKSEASEP